MSFDKVKAMRSAERYLSQGKIRAAINEYKQIVEHDPKDFSTLNMLGDLHIKNADKAEAVECFTRVAEHYGKQGFSQKAIAIYNKISRLQPDSTEVSAKLAELYQSKGSLAEARSHYITLAEQFQRGGKKMEALSTWKQVAELDPNNTEVYLKIAESYLQENRKDEAAAAFTEAGQRLMKLKNYEAALTAFSCALEIHQNDFNALNGFVKSQISLGYSDEAAKTLEQILEKQPYNRDLLFLLVDCYLETEHIGKAEDAVVRLVEQEPASYPRFLDLIEVYLKRNDLESAARVLSLSSEYLLVGGQSGEFLALTEELLTRNPEHLDGLRLLVRYYGWQRDEKHLKNALERLAEVARANNSEEDEKYALAQLAAIAPHETDHADRLSEIKGEDQPETIYEDAVAVESIDAPLLADVPQFESFAMINAEEAEANGANGFHDFEANGFQDFEADGYQTNGESGVTDFDFAVETFAVDANESEIAFGGSAVENLETFGEVKEISATGDAKTFPQLSAAAEMKLEKELEGIEFYQTQGYADLAAKSLDDLEAEFGERPEINEFRTKYGIVRESEEAAPIGYGETTFVPESSNIFAADIVENTANAADNFAAAEPPSADEPPPAAEPETNHSEAARKSPDFGFMDEFRDELGLEESASEPSGDYETAYQMATAYKEMGLTEEAIRSFQEAIGIVAPNDGTRRFFQCAHLLGNCFMEKQMPNLALLWYNRALETNNLNDDEIQGIRYEIGTAFAESGDREKALENFEMIYALNVNYRDISERIKRLHADSEVTTR